MTKKALQNQIDELKKRVEFLENRPLAVYVPSGPPYVQPMPYVYPNTWMGDPVTPGTAITFPLALYASD
jgi:hypothetical protein